MPGPGTAVLHPTECTAATRRPAAGVEQGGRRMREELPRHKVIASEWMDHIHGSICSVGELKSVRFLFFLHVAQQHVTSSTLNQTRKGHIRPWWTLQKVHVTGPSMGSMSRGWAVIICHRPHQVAKRLSKVACRSPQWMPQAVRMILGGQGPKWPKLNLSR